MMRLKSLKFIKSMLLDKISEYEQLESPDLAEEFSQYELELRATYNDVFTRIVRIETDIGLSKSRCKDIYQCKGRIAAVRFVKDTHCCSLSEAVQIVRGWVNKNNWISPK